MAAGKCNGHVRTRLALLSRGQRGIGVALKCRWDRRLAGVQDGIELAIHDHGLKEARFRMTLEEPKTIGAREPTANFRSLSSPDSPCQIFARRGVGIFPSKGPKPPRRS